MVKIELSDYIIKVLPLIKVSKIDTTGAKIEDLDLFWGGTVLENIMTAWGKFDEHIPGSELTEEGRIWDKDLEDKAWDVYKYIAYNIADIISILFYYSPNKIEEGVYTRKNRMPGIWYYQPLNKAHIPMFTFFKDRHKDKIEN